MSILSITVSFYNEFYLLKTIIFLTYTQILDFKKPVIKKDTFVAVDIEDD